MRKCFMQAPALTIAVFLFLSPSLFAQNASPYWSLAGNSNASSSSKLGTTTGIPLRIFTKNLERMRIDTAGRVGIGMTNPAARLAVNTPTGTAAFVVQIGGSTKLFMHSNGGLAVGGSSTPPATGLYVRGNVGIGTNTPAYKLQVNGNASISSQLVVGNGGVYGYNSNGPGVYASGSVEGVYATSTGTYGVYGNSSNIGVYGQGGTTGVSGYAPGGQGFGTGVNGQSSYIGVNGYGGSYGVYGTSYNSSGGFGVYGSANTSSGTGVYATGYYGLKAISPTLYGVDATGYYVGVIGRGNTSNSSSFGVEGWGNNTNGVGVFGQGGNIGVQGYASSSGGKGVYGSGTSGAWAGYFSGPVFLSVGYTTSDQKLKKNIEDVSTATDIINKLHPKMYEFRQDGNYKYMNLPEGKHYGLIAQELEKVLPTLVKDTKFDTRIEQQAQAKAQGQEPGTTNTTPSSEVIDFKAVNYTELIPIVIKGMQEQSELIKQQQAQIDDLKAQVSRLSGGGNIVTSMGTLGQNTPNPARTSTRISYSVPSNSRAQLLITDAAGKTVKALSLNNSGYVNFNAVGLSSGIYTYSLMVDGKIAETKKMEIVH